MFTRIFLPLSSLSHVRAKERNAALLAAYTPNPGKPFTEATDPVMMRLRAVFDPQMGTVLSAIHDRVNTAWTVESLAETAGMSRSAFAARFKDLLGQTPLEYVTEWRMQKAMRLLEQRDKKLIDVARSVGYESDAAFSKAFKRVVGANPGEYLKRGFEGSGNARTAGISPLDNQEVDALSS
jgi:AraC-like DNA-binding protein